MGAKRKPVGDLQPARAGAAVGRGTGLAPLLLGLVTLFLAGCGPSATPAPSAPSAPPDGLTVTWASVEYVASPAGDVTAVLDVVVDNRAARGTRNTSILWEPAFAATFAFVVSDPVPWRSRIDERGWGVLDTQGVQPGRSATFRLRFTSPASAGPPAAPAAGPALADGLKPQAPRVASGAAGAPNGSAPRIVVVANGEKVIAETVANLRPVAPTGYRPAQERFERGTLATVADGVAMLPEDGRQAFPYAAGLGAVLGLLVAGGTGAALRLAAGAPSYRRPRDATAGELARPDRGSQRTPSNPEPQGVRWPAPAQGAHGKGVPATPRPS